MNDSCQLEGVTIPQEWIDAFCPTESFGTNDGCNCECGGVLDPDCGTGRAPSTICALNGRVCLNGVCVEAETEEEGDNSLVVTLGSAIGILLLICTLIVVFYVVSRWKNQAERPIMLLKEGKEPFSPNTPLPYGSYEVSTCCLH